MSRGGGRKSEFTTEEPVAKVTFSGRITGKSLPMLVTMPHCQQAAGSTGRLLCPYPTPHRAANQRAGAELVGHTFGGGAAQRTGVVAAKAKWRRAKAIVLALSSDNPSPAWSQARCPDADRPAANRTNLR